MIKVASFLPTSRKS
uniref:Uncharacterized protein n=1 Tax=Megaselia scalaris TaxID=36166 RepID=T1H0E8_MEGSC